MIKQSAFQINIKDNVATALTQLGLGETNLVGDFKKGNIYAMEKIPHGHKIALEDIKKGEFIIKYGVVIAKSTTDIKKGSWVHLHVCESLYDTRSEHLDSITGAPKDIKYE
ncbi:MAG: UxaA family hydrolase [Lachnospirales bacterium]